MRPKLTAATALALCAAFTAMPALAKDACLQNNRIESTKVLDNETILATDKGKNEYTIHMNGKCIGLDKFAQLLSFRPKTELGCLERGDSISYSLPGDPSQGARSITVHGAQTQLPCYVDNVTAGAPAKTP